MTPCELDTLRVYARLMQSQARALEVAAEAILQVLDAVSSPERVQADPDSGSSSGSAIFDLLDRTK